MIFVNESIASSRPRGPGCPPCSGECNQGRLCPGPAAAGAAGDIHPPPDRSTAGGLEPFGDEDADGLGLFRGLLLASAMSAACWVLAWGMFRLTQALGVVVP